MCNKDDSPALRLVKIVWEYGSKQSYQKFNWALQNAVRIAIEGGLEFCEGDFDHIFNKMRGYRWFVKEGHAYGEWMYTAACKESRNPSAWKSFESWRGRKPFIVDGQRLHVDAWFEWRSQKVKVTSFAEDESYLVACSYRAALRGEGTWHEYSASEVAKIYKITHADIFACNKELKDAAAKGKE